MQGTNKNNNWYLERELGQPRQAAQHSWRLPSGKFTMYESNCSGTAAHGALSSRRGTAPQGWGAPPWEVAL